MTTEKTEITETAELDLAFVDRVIEEKGRDPSAVIPILQAIQQRYRWLPEEALRRVCDRSDITPSAITGVSSFYSQFRHQPVGRHMVSVCRGTACHVRGGVQILREVEEVLGIKPGETTDDFEYSLETTACFGSCALAPVMVVDKNVYGRMTTSKVRQILTGAK